MASLSPTVLGDTPAADLLQLFPERVGTFQRIGRPTPPLKPPPAEAEIALSGSAEYSKGRDRFQVFVERYSQDAQAYSAVTAFASIRRSQNVAVELNSEYGTSGFHNANELVFFRGSRLVRIVSSSNNKSSAISDFAHALNELLDKGEGEIPPLVKHLPNWEENQKRAEFLSRFRTLEYLVPNQGALSVLDTGGDADAVLADTGSGKVLIIEFHTPQLAKDNDERIIAKIHELWKLGQPAP